VGARGCGPDDFRPAGAGLVSAGMRLVLGLVVVVLLLVGACSNGPAAPECTGDQCVCESGKSCFFNWDTCEVDGGSCALTCSNRTSCAGACLNSCNVTCTDRTVCSLFVGDGARVMCDGDSTCHVHCSGTCWVACKNADCDLTCGDKDTHHIPNGGTCPWSIGG
jgi:hypothetical protein